MNRDSVQDVVQVTPKELREAVITVLRAGLVPNIQSSPGMGKSEIVASIAKEFNLKLIDFRLSQADPTDMVGIPAIDNGRTVYNPPKDFPLDTDTVPEGYSGWLLFLDELNSAPLAVQASAYKLILDKAVGQHKLHPAVAIVGAGNLATDKAIVNRMGTATQSRMVHFTLKVDNEGWLDWAIENDVDYRIRAFIKFKPNMLHNFDPNHSDKTFPCPRTWKFLSNMTKEMEVIPKSALPLIAGTIGTGAAFEFQGFSEIYESLPTIEKILESPNDIEFDRHEPSILYAITSLVAYNANKDNISDLMQFINRLPNEFSVITLREIVRIDRNMIKHQVIQKWIQTAATELF